MENKIIINIPEGKKPIVEEDKNSVNITWVDKKLTYDDIVKKLREKDEEQYIPKCRYALSADYDGKMPADNFYDKVNVIRKLTNIRNYFGKPQQGGYFIFQDTYNNSVIDVIYTSKNQNKILFTKREHAEEAIRILGDEIKYLFELW